MKIYTLKWTVLWCLKAVRIEIVCPHNIKGFINVILHSKYTDCQSRACTCRGPGPTLDGFRRCPKHGHRYRSVRGLAPTGYRTRYVQTEPETFATNEYIDSTANRRKRQVSETNDIFSSLLKTTDTIMGSIKPTVKSIASTLQAILNKAEEEEHYITKRQTIIDDEAENVAKLQESLNVEAEIKIENVIPEAENSTDEAVDKIKYSCPTVASLKLSGNSDLLDRPEVLQYLPEVGDSEPIERTRKDCQSCGHKGTTHYPCPKCGYIHPAYGYPDHAQFYEVMDGMPVAYTPGQLARSEDQVQKIRPIYDRLGHQYVENPETGNLRLMAPKSANYDYDVPQNPYNELHHILENYQEYLHDVNSHSSGTGLTDSPVNIVLDAIKFMSDATLHGNGKTSSDYARSANDNEYEIDDLNAFEMNGKFQPSPDMMYSPSEKSSSGPVKRSFKFTPISQDETDGSVLVRISPTKATQEKLKQIGILPSPNSYKRSYYDDGDVQQMVKKERKVVPAKSGARPFKKMSRNGKQYEILTLNDDFAMYDENSAELMDVDDVNYDEDNAELLKYIYRAQQATNGPRRTDKLRSSSANLNDDNFTIEDYDSSVQFA